MSKQYGNIIIRGDIMKYKDKVINVDAYSTEFGKMYNYLCADPMKEDTMCYVQDMAGVVKHIHNEYNLSILSTDDFADKCNEILRNCKIGFLPFIDGDIYWLESGFSHMRFSTVLIDFIVFMQNGDYLRLYADNYKIWVQDDYNEEEIIKYLKEKFV